MTNESAPVRPRSGQIIVGVDGSRSSIDTLREAARLARALDHDLVAMITWPELRLPAEAMGIDWSPEIEAAGALDAAIAAAFGEEVPDRLFREVRRGQAARTLIAESVGAAMLVVGSRGHGGFVGMILGSVSAACAEYAHCPVLVYHQPHASTA